MLLFPEKKGVVRGDGVHQFRQFLLGARSGEDPAILGVAGAPQRPQALAESRRDELSFAIAEMDSAVLVNKLGDQFVIGICRSKVLHEGSSIGRSAILSPRPF
jgi:hypothetical protein